MIYKGECYRNYKIILYAPDKEKDMTMHLVNNISCIAEEKSRAEYWWEVVSPNQFSNRNANVEIL